MKYISILIVALISFFSTPQPKVMLNGKVFDHSTSKSLKNVEVKITNLVSNEVTTAVARENGRYSVIFNPGRFEVKVSLTGYSNFADTLLVNCKKDTLIELNIALKPIKEFTKPETSDKGESTEKHLYEHKTVLSDAKKAPKAAPKFKSRGSSETYTASGMAYSGLKSSSDGESGLFLGDRVKYESSGMAGEIKAGTLTAGEINDFSKWTLWNDLSNGDLKSFTTYWNIQPKTRFSVLITNEERIPLADIKVELKSAAGVVVWTGRTDNTGKAELWANLFDSTSITEEKYALTATFKGKKYNVDQAKLFGHKLNKIIIPAPCKASNNMDIVFAVDATGSMGDEINYLQAELADVINKVKQRNPNLSLNMGSVFYRDKGDSYLTVQQDLTADIPTVMNFIKAQVADGGGDEPEAVDAAMEIAIDKFKWREEARSRVMFLVLDASPHHEKENIEKIQKYTTMAAAKGIRIIPVVCSGIDKAGEYLMRSIALATNGTYLFLTDHSGIGDSHIAPSTDKFKVETLNVLIEKILQQYTFIPTCDKEMDIALLDTLQNTQTSSNKNDTALVKSNEFKADSSKVNDAGNWILKYYPNPCRGTLKVDVIPGISELYIADINGKLIMQIPVNKDNSHLEIDLTAYPSGIYFLRYCVDGVCKSGKFVLIN
jgi:hypothetical protein